MNSKYKSMYGTPSWVKTIHFKHFKVKKVLGLIIVEQQQHLLFIVRSFYINNQTRFRIKKKNTKINKLINY